MNTTPASPAQSSSTSNTNNEATSTTSTSGPSDLDSSEFRDPYDCTPCRIIGSVTFAGTGAYVLYEGRRQLAEEHTKYLRDLPSLRYGYLIRKASVGVIGYGLVGLGLYRWMF